MRHVTQLTVVLNAALMLTGIGAAQTNRAATPQAATPVSSAGAEPQGVAPQNETPHSAPVFWISSVEVMRSTHAPQLDVIRVRGLASTEGWESAELVPLTKGAPVDGVLDLMLIAEAPADNTATVTYPTIEAIFTMEPGHPFTGVRIHGAENRVTVKTFPGYAESALRPIDCAGCVGKYFARKGEALSGHTKESVIREEELPHNLRVLRDTDGVGTLYSDPNRMTLLLNAEGQIVVAMWD
jgi:hypothetical protein